MNVGFHLMYISREWKKGDILSNSKDTLWDVHGFKWKLKSGDIRDNSDFIDEQLWAMHQGLA